jgi:hypothetical protein
MVENSFFSTAPVTEGAQKVQGMLRTEWKKLPGT